MVLPYPISPQSQLSADLLDQLEETLLVAVSEYEVRISETPDIEDLSQAVYSRALKEANDALGRIEAGVYGRCQECGGAITLERLKALPHIATCTLCANGASGRS